MNIDAKALDDLIDALLEDQLDAGGAQRLQQQVMDDPEALRHFVRRVHLDADIDALHYGAERGLRVPLPAGVPQGHVRPSIASWRRWGAAVVLMLLAWAVSQLRVETPSYGSRVRRVGDVAIEHHPEHVSAQLGRGWLAWSWRSRGQAIIEGPAEVHLHADGMTLIRGRVWMRAGRQLPLRLKTSNDTWSVLDGEIGAIHDLDRDLMEIHALRGVVLSESGTSLDTDHAMVVHAKDEPKTLAADRDRFVRALDDYGPTHGGGLLLADRFAYEAGSLEGRHAGFERSPLARWLGPWTYFRPMSEDTVFGVRDGIVRVDGGTNVHENMLRAFVLDQPQRTSTWFSIRMRVFEPMPNAGPRRRSNLTFDGTVINIGIQNQQFRLKLQTENDLLFGRVVYGRWYRLVGRVDFDVEGLSDRLSMWVDPTSEDQVPGGVLEGRDIGSDLGNDLQIHRDDRVVFDFADVRIGTDFASVVPEAAGEKSR